MTKQTEINAEWATKKARYPLSFFTYDLAEGERAVDAKKQIKQAFAEIGMEVTFGNVETVSKRWNTSGGLPKSSKRRKFMVKKIK